MNPFKKRKGIKELRQEVENERKERVVIKEKNERINVVVTDMHQHLKDNNFGKRFYASLLKSMR